MYYLTVRMHAYMECNAFHKDMCVIALLNYNYYYQIINVIVGTTLKHKKGYDILFVL